MLGIRGRELLDLAAVGFGMAGTSFIDKKFVNPTVTKFLPSSGVAGEAVDAATTWLSAMALGWVVGLVSRNFQGPVELGGKALAVGKVISIPVPGYHLDATLPIAMGTLALPGGKAAAAAAAPPLSTTASQGIATNYPAPNQQFDVGL